ncbi:helix-turn-helix domain-containing protein [Magnetofaba australis]|uniref:Putative helix-turn-helix domain-containing protein n=1 Tax=Magnetofaba australis IT-1 TaxID=1434232 RepID=A0A1Y2K3G8_9PROT|nr:helix-turn-helix transcriptional regulator [Magnetofaba australis]OSM02543.1 putative helix-turn-helix domain-containing protein [Magnetofaba australis IT-1]
MSNIVAQRIQAYRQEKGLSLRGLAERAKISAAGLSQIENGQTSPSVATLEKLADALDIPVAAFFADAAEPLSEIEVLSLDKQPLLHALRSAELLPLGSRRFAPAFEPMLIRLLPNGRMAKQPFGVGNGVEFVWIRSGRAVLEYCDEEFTLQETQSVYYLPHHPHNWKNPYDAICELLVIRSR